MGLFNKNRNTLPPLDRRPQKPSKPITKETRLRAVLTLLLTFAFVFLYFLIHEIAQRINSPALAYILMYSYATALAVLLIAYFIYNRGFAFKNATPDMLPDDIPHDDKVKMIEDAKLRMKKSKWMLMFIIPLLATFISEACYQFIWLNFLSKYF